MSVDAMTLQGLEPIVADGARVLVLGSMPSAASLAAGEYYAHPRNGFWPCMGELVGAVSSMSYAERTARLTAAGVGALGCDRSMLPRGRAEVATL